MIRSLDPSPSKCCGDSDDSEVEIVKVAMPYKSMRELEEERGAACYVLSYMWGKPLHSRAG